MMKKQNLLMKLFLLCAMIVGGVNGVWADQTYHTITPNNGSDDYETYGLYRLFDNKAVKSGYTSWVTGELASNASGSNYTAPTGWLAGNTAADPGYGYVQVKTQTITFYVTNCIEVAMVSKSGGSRYCQLSVKDASTSEEVGTIAQNGNTLQATTYGTALNASKNYIVTLSGTSSSNQTFYQIRFKAPQTGVKKPNFGVAADSPLVKSSDTVGLTSAGNTIYYKWSTTSGDYSESDGSTLASDADDSGSSPVDATAPATTGTWYLYAVAMDGESNYSDVVCKSYTITNQTYSVTKGSTSHGSFTISATLAEEGEEVSLTASPYTGYEFTSWTVTKDEDGSDVTATVVDGNTLTMPAYAVTVTATFTAVDYTITYTAAENGTYTVKVGSASAVSTSTTANYNQTITLTASPEDGYVLAGWNVTKTSGGDAVSMATANTFLMPAEDVTIAPTFVLSYNIIYNANGGTGSMSNTEGAGSINLSTNTYTKAGYTFIGWATSQANANAGTVAYADGATYPLSGDVTLYAVWGENYYEFAPTLTTGNLAVGNEVVTSSGGRMKVVGIKQSGSIAYKTDGLLLSGGGADSVRVILNDYLKIGSVISVKLKSSGTGGRGLKMYDTLGSHEQVLGWSSATSGAVGTFQYTVAENDGYVGTKEFRLVRNNSVYLKSLTVTDCQPGGVITASGWSTYSCNKKLDLSTISGGCKAYVATGTEDGKVVVKSCTDIVDAEEGLMIWGTPGAKFTINTTSETSNLSETNLMVGVPNGGSAPVGSYVFGWPTASENPGNDCGFYYVNSAAATLGNTKAYLNTAGSGARLTIVFEDESETTGISDATRLNDNGQLTNDNYYDLQGRKVAQPTKGLYIVNGKKVIIK